MPLEETIVIGIVVIAVVYLVSRPVVAFYESKRANAQKMQAIYTASTRKKAGKKTDSSDMEVSIIGTLMTELGVPEPIQPAALGFIQAQVQKYIEGAVKPGAPSGDEGKYI